MRSVTASGATPRARTMSRRIRHAAIWTTPRSALAVIVSVEMLCVTWLCLANAFGAYRPSDMGRFVLLFAIAAVYAESGDRIERLRRYVGYVENSLFVNASSLWCLAAALALPVGLAGTFAALLYAHNLLRARRHRATQPYRMIYTGATEVLAAMVAATVMGLVSASTFHLGDAFSSVAAVAVAMLAYAVVNQGLVVGVVSLVVRPTSLRTVMLTAEDQRTELATLCLAVLLAAALVHAPYLVPFTLPLILVLRRSALVRELQVQATRDAKTGLLNAGGWRQEAERELVRAERTGGSLSVLMVDLDHFKTLNDSFGHPAGDAALRAVAECLTEALRGYDAVGRFGGEEFIALLVDADEKVSAVIAERLCDRIRGMELAHGGGITASIGVAVGTAGDHGLDDLISLADKALYVAKGAGRDQVRIRRAPVSAPASSLRVAGNARG